MRRSRGELRSDWPAWGWEEVGVSHSTLWLVHKTTARVLAEYRNGHGSAPPIWDLLWSRYVERGRRFPIHTERRHGELWALASERRVAESHRIALGLTFDRVVVSLAPASLVRVADALDEVHREILDTDYPMSEYEFSRGKWTWTHLPAIARHLRACSMPCTCDDARCLGKVFRRISRGALGIGLGCTSVNDLFEGWSVSQCKAKARGVYMLDDVISLPADASLAAGCSR